jgi:hypothetical protein
VGRGIDNLGYFLAVSIPLEIRPFFVLVKNAKNTIRSFIQKRLSLTKPYKIGSYKLPKPIDEYRNRDLVYNINDFMVKGESFLQYKYCCFNFCCLVKFHQIIFKKFNPYFCCPFYYISLNFF